MNITQKEAMVLDAILNSDYHDGSDPVMNPVWSFSCNPFDSITSLGGVMASLKKKGLADTDDDGDDAVCFITVQGWKAINEIYNVGLACGKCGGLGYTGKARKSCQPCQGSGNLHVNLVGSGTK